MSMMQESHLRLSRAEYWLLQAAVDCLMPVFFLETEGYPPNSSIEEMFNKPGHGLDRHELLECLDGLFGAGFIEARRDDSEQPFVPTKVQLIEAIAEKRWTDQALNYGLTAKGGATWEAFAAPDWSHFYAEDYDQEALTGTVTCLDRDRLQQYLDYLKLNLMDEIIAFDTLQIVECGEWQPTYWKQLPSGFRAEFSWAAAPANNEVQSRLQYLAFCGLANFRDGWYQWR